MFKHLPLNIADRDRILKLYQLYRISLGMILVILVASDIDQRLLAGEYLRLFGHACWGYLILNILMAVLSPLPQNVLQSTALILTDIFLLLILFYTAGGARSGVGSLLVINVGFANIILKGRIGLLPAAISSIGMIYLTFYLSIDNPAAVNDYVQVGALGTLCFITALAIQGISTRLLITQDIALQRASDVANLQALNTLIIERLPTGILVLNARRQILMANQKALEILGQSKLDNQLIDFRLPHLYQAFQHWQQTPGEPLSPIKETTNGITALPSFVMLQHGQHSNTLIFLEDLTVVAQQAQQMKLASLGHLTASMAHEIRNPLGAISHAGQLLIESETLDKQDHRLAQIIVDHTHRINAIIESILHLSRRRIHDPAQVDVKDWLQGFVASFQYSHPAVDRYKIHLSLPEEEAIARFVTAQMEQVLTNLVENALRFSGQLHDANAQAWIKLYYNEAGNQLYLEVGDDGPGVAPENVDKLFEPFFTTDNRYGTGLGLYLANELCESNTASINYVPNNDGGSCFRIVFTNIKKRTAY